MCPNCGGKHYQGYCFQCGYSPHEEVLDERQVLLHRKACDFYKSQISDEAYFYLEERQIPQDLINKFEIGYATEDWDRLKVYLWRQGFTKEEIIGSGLMSESKGRVYDRFRDRIMFPLKDGNGIIRGFSGRQLHDNSYSGKYMNSPTTPLYNKSENLFGLYESEGDTLILGEGEVDILSSHRVGVKNIVCVKGSGLTMSHGRILRDLGKKIILAFDNDIAGYKATYRSIKVLLYYGVIPEVIYFDEANDPDELIKQDPEKWINAKPISCLDFMLKICKTDDDIIKLGEIITYLSGAGFNFQEMIKKSLLTLR